MNEQPQNSPQKLPGEQGQLYQSTPEGGDSPSMYAGYDLARRASTTPGTAPQEGITWNASEYIHHSKGAGWLVGFVAGVVILFALAVLTQAWTFAALIVVMGIALGILAFRQPHVLHYTLNEQGLQIDNKFYGFEEFRAFGVVEDGALYSIMLLPIKRLAPAVTVYFDEQDGERIVDLIGLYLPMEHLEQDFFDRLMRRLRF